MFFLRAARGIRIMISENVISNQGLRHLLERI